MSGCQTCGGGMGKHDPIAHDQQPEQVVTYADTLDRLLRLVARSRRVLDYVADEIQQGRTLNLNDAGIAQDLASEIVGLIGHSITDQPEAPEMFALREFVDEASENAAELSDLPARDRP